MQLMGLVATKPNEEEPKVEVQEEIKKKVEIP